MFLVLFIAATVGGFVYFNSLYSNITKARKSGIPYLIVPFQPYTFASRLTFILWGPLLRYTPASWRWADFMHPDLQWNKLYGPFERLGFDTVLLCSPGQIVFHTCAADVISQVISRKDQFPKPEKLYKIVDVYGPSVISTEGHEWRKHRKALAVVYTHKTYELVWDETIRQFQAILAAFVGDKTSSRELTTLDKSVNHAALAVISCAGYGVPLEPSLSLSDKDWQTSNQGSPTGRAGVFQPDWVQGRTHSHNLSYVDSIRGITSNILWIAGVPRPMLKHLPFQRARYAYNAYKNWGQYMREMVSERRRLEGVHGAKAKHTSDLLSSLVQSTEDKSYVTTEGSKAVRKGFTDEQLLADIFITMIGGHKTTATTIRFGLLLLAMNLDSQRRLQKDIDRILAGKNPETWKYEHDFAALFKGMAGAVVAEVLRWLPPILAIPKLAVADRPITVNGKSCIVPRDTLVALNVVAAHRNPKQWSSHFSSCQPKNSSLYFEGCTNDLDAFKPERWLESMSSGAKTGNDLGVITEAAEVTTDVVDGVYKPVAGSYLPFSAGSRICLGRQFAQTEAVVVLALIFREFSIELSVDKWATDAEVERMTEENKREVWLKARQEALSKFRNGIECLLSADMKGSPIPVRLVRRGHERFAYES